MFNASLTDLTFCLSVEFEGVREWESEREWESYKQNKTGRQKQIGFYSARASLPAIN